MNQTQAQDTHPSSGGLKYWLLIGAMTAVCLQWLVLRALHWEGNVILAAVLPGVAIFAAAYVLSWGADLLQMDVPQTLALALLALIAVLPEYAVDMYFAWMAGKDPSYMSWATANMTGSNRLLIGLGWPIVLAGYWWGTRKRVIVLEPHHKVEFRALFIATVYCFIIPLKGTLSLIDFFLLVAVFVYYLYGAMQAHVTEPELEGPAEYISQKGTTVRRLFTLFFFALAGITIFFSAEPFAEGLLSAGRVLGVEEFILVQWLAPLASESPEFIVAVLFALRGLSGASLGTLISSKVNQWTLLVGMLPLVFAISGGHMGPMRMDSRQVEEILLTAGQSFFALALVIDFTFSFKEALILLVLFSTQLFFTDPAVRYVYAVFYIVAGAAMLAFSRPRRESLLGLFRK